MARKYRVISALLGSIHATDDTRKNKNETWQMNSRNNLHTHTYNPWVLYRVVQFKYVDIKQWDQKFNFAIDYWGHFCWENVEIKENETAFWGKRPKLYIPSTLNIDLILWHTQLNVCA